MAGADVFMYGVLVGKTEKMLQPAAVYPPIICNMLQAHTTTGMHSINGQRRTYQNSETPNFPDITVTTGG
jgi:hypothetical protein